MMTDERMDFIDDLVDKWHMTTVQLSLVEFLKHHGVSEDEWRVYFIGGLKP